MKIGVIVFPGSNCDEDMVHVLKDVLNQNVVKLWHKDKDIKGCDLLVLPGGFSFGDYLRSGAIARFSPIMDNVIDHAEKGGLVFGICNGFQILTEAGLLPGALLRNRSQKFVCKNAYIKPVSKSSVLTSKLDFNKAYTIPIAHAEGRYFAPEEVLNEMEKNDQVLFKYCDINGIIDDKYNLNGSARNIAGVMNARNNVFGMMPHPERASECELGNDQGREIFESLLSMIEA
jgi:phosphoribosylformylglycinamidine synthase subunit PurQ / glutaminase